MMTSKLNYYNILFISVLFSFCAVAANAMDVRDFTFQQIGVQQGLLSQRVYSIIQSKDGAIWWTAKNCVYRSNGAVIQNYDLNSQEIYNSSAGQQMRFAHSAGKLNDIVAFNKTGGIYRYNVIQNRFDKIPNSLEKRKDGAHIHDMLLADDGMWLGLKDGVYKLDDNGKLKQILKDVNADYILQIGKLKLFCTRQGIFAYENGKVKGKVLDICHVITAYYDQKMRNLWLGTFDDGVKVVDMKKGFGNISSLQVPDNPVRAICQYGNDKMLLGIDGFGVYESSRTQNYVKVLFNANDGREGVLHGNGVYGLLVDSWNDILIGTYSGGIDIARPVASTTAIFQHVKNSEQSLVNDHVNCLRQLGDDILLMGTDDGVSIFNSKTSVWNHTARGMVVLDICKNSDGGCLMATYGNGVCDMATGRQVYGTSNGTLTDDYVYKLCYDKAGNLWMGTLSGGLVVKTANGMKHFDIDYVMSLYPMADGRVAVGTSHGLYLVGVGDSNPHEQIYMKGKKVNRCIIDLYETPDRRLWLATDGGGVYVYNEKTHATTQITTKQGLPSNCVTSITTDDRGRIWFGTETGLAFVHIDKPMKVFDVNYCYGLNTEYSQRAVANLANGDIIFGTVNGALIINPKKIGHLGLMATLTIRGVRLHNEASSLDEFNEKIFKELAEGEIHLDYDQRSFDISFESINLRNQFDIAYQYKMGDGSWMMADGEQQYISFENLEPGSHVLSIRCVSKTSDKVLDEKTITIVIAQPWWNSWWMWCIYIMLIALAFYGAWWMYGLHNKYMRLLVDKVAEQKQIIVEEQKETAIPEEPAAEEDSDLDIQTEEDVKDDGNEFISSATKIVLDNLKDNDFTIDVLCRKIGMSRTLFYVKLKTYTGISPQDFVRTIRLEKAATLLRQGHSVTDVSTLTGFDNPKYFSTVFKKYFGVSPSKYE